VYSTDLMPGLLRNLGPTESVSVAARALKIKIISKGLVTLNTAFLLSPLAVALFDAHPDLLGAAILPAFRNDKESLNELAASQTDADQQIPDPGRRRDHLARLEEKIDRVIPFEVGGIGERFRALLLEGLANPNALIARELKSMNAPDANIDNIAQTIARLDFSSNVHLRAYLSTLSEPVRQPLSRFTTASYHMVGTGLLRCETGTDLNPLSEFKAADLVLASRTGHALVLSDEAVFLKAFFGYALDAIHSAAIPEAVIDALSFKNAHDVSEALRARGFQDRYDGVVRQYLRSSGQPDARQALDALKPDHIAGVARNLADQFQAEILKELKLYKTRQQTDAAERVYKAGADVTRNAASSIPGVSELVSFAETTQSGLEAASAVQERWKSRSREGSLAIAEARRSESIRTAIQSLRLDSAKKATLLDAVALLSDIHGIATQRA